MDAGNKKKAEIRKAAALQPQQFRGPSNGCQSSKKAQGLANCPNQAEMVQNTLKPPYHGMDKGLMTS